MLGSSPSEKGKSLLDQIMVLEEELKPKERPVHLTVRSYYPQGIRVELEALVSEAAQFGVIDDVNKTFYTFNRCHAVLNGSDRTLTELLLSKGSSWTCVQAEPGEILYNHLLENISKDPGRYAVLIDRTNSSAILQEELFTVPTPQERQSHAHQQGRMPSYNRKAILIALAGIGIGFIAGTQLPSCEEPNTGTENVNKF